MGQPWSNQSGGLPGPKAQPLREEAPFIRLLGGDREEGVCAQLGQNRLEWATWPCLLHRRDIYGKQDNSMLTRKIILRTHEHVLIPLSV